MSAGETTTIEDTGAAIDFFVLKQGTKDPLGPMPEVEILRLLNESEITPYDLVYYEGIQQWQPLAEIFVIEDQISHFVDDGQDKTKVGEVFREVSSILSKDEDIYYIAFQEKAGLLSKAKASVVITDRHIFLLRETRSGWEIEGYPWSRISNTLMRDEGKGIGTFSILLDLENRIDVAHIPMRQLRRLFQLSQELRGSDEEGKPNHGVA